LAPHGGAAALVGRDLAEAVLQPLEAEPQEGQAHDEEGHDARGEPALVPADGRRGEQERPPEREDSPAGRGRSWSPRGLTNLSTAPTEGSSASSTTATGTVRRIGFTRFKPGVPDYWDVIGPDGELVRRE